MLKEQATENMTIILVLTYCHIETWAESEPESKLKYLKSSWVTKGKQKNIDASVTFYWKRNIIIQYILLVQCKLLFL